MRRRKDIGINDKIREKNEKKNVPKCPPTFCFCKRPRLYRLLDLGTKRAVSARWSQVDLNVVTFSKHLAR